ncbi:DUF846-domain-containing protein [Neoconidiobolus thromboides FSU 785]|nr:DUF846-domain-containing protein [Neoconidiobolus thromboides FSU 785]
MNTNDNSNLLSNAAPMGRVEQDSTVIEIDNELPTYSSSQGQQSFNPEPSLPTQGNNNNNRNNNNIGTDNSVTSLLKQSSHPTILIVHFLFRTLALILYLFANFVSHFFVLIFVFSVLCLAFDFWVVKNVSGRYLVGLRWWNEIDSNGHSIWYFESKDINIESNAIDSKCFWVSLYATPIIWILLALVALIRFNFEWLLIVLVAIGLSGTNLIGYHRCEKDAKQKWGNNNNNSTLSLFGSNNSFVGGFINRSLSNYLG